METRKVILCCAASAAVSALIAVTATAAAIGTLRKEYSDRESEAVRQRVTELSGGRQDHHLPLGRQLHLSRALHALREHEPLPLR